MRLLKREPNLILEDHCVIGLTHGYSTLVSPEDFEYLITFNWSCHCSVQNRVVRYKHRRVVYLHRVIAKRKGFEFKPFLEIDHINGDTLDNRRENIRIVDHYENMRNTDRHRNRKCYSYNTAVNLWFAYIPFPDSKQASLGYYRTEEEAKLAAEQGKLLNRKYTTKDELYLAWKRGERV